MYVWLCVVVCGWGPEERITQGRKRPHAGTAGVYICVHGNTTFERIRRIAHHPGGGLVGIIHVYESLMTAIAMVKINRPRGQRGAFCGIHRTHFHRIQADRQTGRQTVCN